MILLLNTSTPKTELILVEADGSRRSFEWDSGRGLSKGLLGFMRNSLAELGADFSGIAGLGVYKGPGSFTGLRIGIAVLNTLADSLEVPIVGVTGGDWIEKSIELLDAGTDEKIILPFYGADAHITKPRK